MATEDLEFKETPLMPQLRHESPFSVSFGGLGRGKMLVDHRDPSSIQLSTPVRGWENPNSFKMESDSQLGYNSMEKPQITVVVPPQKRIHRFSGTDRNISVDDFISEMQAEIKNERDSLKFVLDHLDGAAKKEVRTCGVHLSSVETVFTILRAAFGDQRSLPAITRTFMERVQEPQEDVRQYASDVFDLFSSVQKKQKELGRPVQDEEVLCDQFVEGLRDRDLVWELRGFMRSHTILFADLRQRAIEYEQNQCSRRKTSRADVREMTLTEEDELKRLRLQVEKLAQMVKMTSTTNSTETVGQKTTGSSRTNRRVGWTDDNRKPICFHCQQAGHFQRDCPTHKTSQNKQNDPLNGNPPA